MFLPPTVMGYYKSVFQWLIINRKHSYRNTNKATKISNNKKNSDKCEFRTILLQTYDEPSNIHANLKN